VLVDEPRGVVEEPSPPETPEIENVSQPAKAPDAPVEEGISQEQAKAMADKWSRELEGYFASELGSFTTG
jgi:hypothetical protein